LSDQTVIEATKIASTPALGRWTTMAERSLRLSMRNLDALIAALALPVMLMLLFVYLLGGAIQTGTEYVTYVVPGVLLLCALFGASLTAVSVSKDMSERIIDRFRSMDVGGPAILAGHVVASLARNVVSAALVLGVALLIGFRPTAGAWEWAAAAGVLLVFILAMSWFSAVIGLVARSPEAASAFTFFVIFLPYPSSAFVPIESMPGWIQGFAEPQPVTPVVESLRGLLVGDGPSGADLTLAFVWSGVILVASIALSSVLFRRRTS
jgi:ABC-2 type transport system permease protein